MGEVDLVGELRRVAGFVMCESADEIERLREELADIRDGNRTILDEKCASDEVHCGCVPTLRGEVERLRNQDIVARALVGPLVDRMRTALEKIAVDDPRGPDEFDCIEIARAALHTGGVEGE
jgi:hypothetical protein